MTKTAMMAVVGEFPVQPTDYFEKAIASLPRERLPEETNNRGPSIREAHIPSNSQVLCTSEPCVSETLINEIIENTSVYFAYEGEISSGPVG